MAEKIIDYKKPYYKGFFGQHPTEKLIIENVRQGPVLDVGCGLGRLLFVLKDKFEVEGFDPSKYAIRIAKKKGINVKVSTIKTFNPRRKYKTILMTGVIAHIYNLKKDFKKVISWLDDDGEIILTIPNASSPFIKRHETHIYFPKFFEFRKFMLRRKFNSIADEYPFKM